MRKTMLDLLFPRRCPVCGKIVDVRQGFICAPCVHLLSPVKEPTCLSCGKEIADGGLEFCRDCAKRKRGFDGGMAVFNYNETAARSMAMIKYRNKREYLDFYAEAMARRLGPRLERLAPQALIPVPVHRSRLRSRGFNQAQELAARLSKHTGIPVAAGLLARGKRTAPQKDLSPAERLKNLEEAFFALPAPAGLSRVLIVDDIYTTGSTMEACARALKKAGVREVYFAALFTSGRQ